MEFDLEARERCRTKVNKQALPLELYATYVVYKYPWWPTIYCLGFKIYQESLNLAEEFRRRGVDAEVTYSYPFEHMNPEKK
jgi:hypothetical protein